MQTDPNLLELTDRIKSAIAKMGGGEIISWKLKMNYTTFKGQLNPHNQSNRFQVGLLLKLIQATIPYSADVIQYLSEMANGIYVPLPTVDKNAYAESLKDLLLRASEEAGDVAKALREASNPESPAGTELNREEKQRLTIEIKEVLSVFFQMLIALGALDKNPGLWNCETCHMTCGKDKGHDG